MKQGERPPPPATAAPGGLLRDARLRRAFPLLILVGIPVALVATSTGNGGTLLGSDMVSGSFHIRGLIGRLFREGMLPTWDPHTMCGYPVLAAFQAGVLYPLTWPIVFLGPGPFWTFTVLVHMILAGLFARDWVKRGLGLGDGAALVGGLVFMLSGYFLTRVLGGHIAQICAYPWLAAVLGRTERLIAAPTVRRWVLLTLSVALLILPGFPQYLFFIGIIVGVRLAAYVVRTKRAGLRTIGIVASAGLAGALLCSPQLLPSFELISQAQRVSHASYEFATQFSVPPENLLGILTPSFLGDDVGCPYWGRLAIWEVTGFVGIGAILLSIFAVQGRHPQRFFWGVAAVLAVLLALGSHTPLYGAFVAGVPGAKLFRAPGRYLTVFTLALTALSALGFQRLGSDDPDARRSVRATAVAAAVLLVGLLVALLLSGGEKSEGWRRFVDAERNHAESMVTDAVRRDPDLAAKAWSNARSSLLQAIVVLALFGGLLVAHERGRLSGPRTSLLVGCLLALELLAFGRGFLKAYDPALIPWPADFVDYLKHHPARPFRLASPGPRNMSHIGKCQLAGLDHVAGYESLALKRYCELINVIHARPKDTVRLVASVNIPHPVLDMLGTKFWLVSEGEAVPPGWRAIGKVSDGSGEFVLLDCPSAYPRAFVVPRSVRIPSTDDRLAFLLNPSTDLRKVVVLESGSEDPASSPDLAAAASITASTAGAYSVSVDSPRDAWLVLTETYYPGWRAWIDGTPAEVLPANHLVQAVRIPAGTHQVRFEYRSTWLGTGFGIAAGVAILAGGAILLLRRTTSASGTPASS